MSGKPPLDPAIRILKPRKAFSTWGEETPKPLPLFRESITNQQLRELAQAYFPAELQAAVDERLLALFSADRRINGPKNKRGRQSTTKLEVEYYERCGMSRTDARRQVAKEQRRPIGNISRSHRRKPAK